MLLPLETTVSRGSGYFLGQFYDFLGDLTMKRFGQHKATDDAVAASEVGNIHLKVRTLSELDLLPTQTVAIMTGNDGPFKTGDVIIKLDDGTWSKIIPGDAIDAATRLRCMRVGPRVIIRWKDPDDSYDANFRPVGIWEKTVLVRKFGSEPVSILDGTQVYENYQRNRFNYGAGEYYADSVPVGYEGVPIYYKTFAVSTGGYINNNSPAVKVAAMPWSEILETIKNGQGSGIFEAGDVLTLSNGAKSIDLICLGNDCTVANRTLTSPHTVAFGFRYLFPGTENEPPYNLKMLQYDITSDYITEQNDGYGYKLTKDTNAQAGKSYYLTRIVNGEIVGFRRVSIAIGSTLKAGSYYERVPLARAKDGNYRWSASDVRSILNSNKYGSPLQMIKEIDPGFAELITETKVSCVKHPSDGGSIEYTVDNFFIPSITEIFGETVLDKFEGTKFPFFEDESNALIFAQRPNGELIAGDWYTRSCDTSIDGGTSIFMIDVNQNDRGEISTKKSSVQSGKTPASCFVVFSIG